MSKKQIVFVSVTAVLALLVFVFSAFFLSMNEQIAKRKVSHCGQLYCSIATSSTITLAQTKPKVDSFDAAAFLSSIVPLLLFRTWSINSCAGDKPVVSGLSRPLWLLKRSLLI